MFALPSMFLPKEEKESLVVPHLNIKIKPVSGYCLPPLSQIHGLEISKKQHSFTWALLLVFFYRLCVLFVVCLFELFLLSQHFPIQI